MKNIQKYQDHHQNDLDTSEYSCCWPEGDARYHIFSNKIKKL